MATEERIDDYTKDGTVDLKGNPVRRSKRGGLKACSFIIAYELLERMAYYGITTNLVLYLTRRLHQGTVKSANNVTNWAGTVWLTPILGAYVADAHLGRYWTFVISIIIYLLGMSLLTLTVSLPSLRPPPCNDVNIDNCKEASTLQLAMFFGGLYIVALGNGGTKPNISTIGADQFDDFEPKEKAQKLSFFNWWMFTIFIGILFANTVLVYIQDNVGWTLGYGLPTLGLLIAIPIFLAGSPFYRHRVPAGSPITRIAKVFFLAIRNRNVSIPTKHEELYELDSEEYAKARKFRIDHTPGLRFLTKAAVKTSSTNPWKSCSVTEVEETKQMLRMIPIWIATFIPSVMAAQINTLFIKQGTTLDRHIGSFKIPPASLSAFITITFLVSLILYDKFFVNFMGKITKNPRGITLLQRMGIGMFILFLIMIGASLTEHYRLNQAKKYGVVENGGEIPVTIFILLPQFILMGIADTFIEIAKIEFFYDQAPESMKSLGTSYSLTTLGVGNFISSFLLSTVSDLTKKHGHKGWILNNLNASRLDYYYAFFAVLNFLNFIFFLIVAKNYVYKAEVSDSMDILAEELKGIRSQTASQEESIRT